MSISVDDLVASLNSNHIGQEAMDIADLHAQLAQALRSPSMQPVQRRGYAPSNTPLARTPSSSFSWESSDFTRARSSSVASVTQRWNTEERLPDIDDMDEDEKMVEDMLFSSPTSSHFPQSAQNLSSSPSGPSGGVSRKPSIPHVSSSYDTAQYDMPPQNMSLFATTDPFFMAQLQAAQNPAPSFFAQSGHPPAHSPFLLASQLQSAYGHAHNHHGVTSEIDPHHVFAAPPATFSC